jgi:cathepsin E
VTVSASSAMAWSLSVVSALYLISLAASPIVGAVPNVRASNGINLPLVKKLNLAGSTIIERDRARAKALVSNASNKPLVSKRQINEPVTNVAVTYIASVDVGSPATTCESIFLFVPWI